MFFISSLLIFIFQIFAQFCNQKLAFISTGYDALPQWLASFDCSVLPRSLDIIPVVVRDYSREMVQKQQVYLKTVSLSFKPNKPIILPVISSPKNFPAKVTTPTISGDIKPVTSLIPCRRQIACVFGGVPGQDKKPFVKPTPDILCHKRAFSTSVIRIPYLTLERISDHKSTSESKSI